MYHVLALVINFILPLYLGARVTFLHVLEAQRILKAFREEGITIFVCVPQFFYLVHRRILQEVERQGFFKRFLFRRLLWVSRFANLRLGLNPGRFFFGAIHKQFGPSLRLFGVGGARFDPDVAESFRDLGFNLLQAFGMSETAALTTVALSKGRAVGTAGVPLPHVEIRIEAPDHERPRRSARARRERHAGLPQEPAGDGRSHPGRLAAHRRSGLYRPARLPSHHGPQEGRDRAQLGQEHLPGGDREVLPVEQSLHQGDLRGRPAGCGIRRNGREAARGGGAGL